MLFTQGNSLRAVVVAQIPFWVPANYTPWRRHVKEEVFWFNRLNNCLGGSHLILAYLVWVLATPLPMKFPLTSSWEAADDGSSAWIPTAHVDSNSVSLQAIQYHLCLYWHTGLHKGQFVARHSGTTPIILGEIRLDGLNTSDPFILDHNTFERLWLRADCVPIEISQGEWWGQDPGSSYLSSTLNLCSMFCSCHQGTTCRASADPNCSSMAHGPPLVTHQAFPAL